MTKYLALDFGTKRIGVAVSRGTLAEPLQILPNTDEKWTKLKEIIAAERIESIIVGMSEREMAEKTRLFAQELQQHTDLPIHFIDESFSSKEMHQKLVESHMKQSKRQQPIDHFVAAELLQEWIDSNE